jgi:hypothetical protein
MDFRGGQAECKRVVLLQLQGPQIRHRLPDQSGNNIWILESHGEGSYGGGSSDTRDRRDEKDFGVLSEQSSQWDQNWLDHA